MNLDGTKRRLRIEDATAAARSSLPWVVAAFALLAWNGAGALVLACIALVPACAALAALACPVPALRAAMALDRAASLPDVAVAGLQCTGDDSWSRCARAACMGSLAGVGSGLRSAHLVRLAAFTILPAMLGLGSLLWTNTPQQWAHENQPERTDQPNQADALPREPAAERREVLISISKAEERLLASRPVPADATALAEALAGIANDVSSALAVGDWAAAARFAAGAAPAAPAPGATAHLEHFAKQLDATGSEALAEALRSLAEAEDDAAHAAAMQQLAKALELEEAVATAIAASAASLARLAAAREAAAEGDTQRALAMLDDTSEGDRGQGAGGGTTAETAPFAREDPSSLLRIEGALTGSGSRHSELAPARELAREAAARPAGPNTTATPGAPSQQAVTPEQLPLAHRAAIKKYFDTIRSQ